MEAFFAGLAANVPAWKDSLRPQRVAQSGACSSAGGHSGHHGRSPVAAFAAISCWNSGGPKAANSC